MAGEAKLDPMHQFAVQPIAHLFDIGGREIFLTNSAVWMLATLRSAWVMSRMAMTRTTCP